MIKLSTKAETLISLKDKLSVAEVLPLIYFTVRQWEEEKENIWIKVSQNLPGNEFIVRSSALNEDTIDDLDHQMQKIRDKIDRCSQ